MAATTALREALNKGISSGNFVDTKFILYSHRDSSGRICRPKAIYANSHVLGTVPHFNDTLFGKFAESQSKDFKEATDEDGCAEGYGYLSDSDLEDDEDEKLSFLKDSGKTKVQQFDPFTIPGEEKIVCEEHEEVVEKGKVVKIEDIALVTFQAFLMYLYTDTIEFAPFGSEQNRRSRSAEIVNPSDDKIPRPSPKSIYRLADKYDVPALKTLALNRIRDELAKCDIVEESFSTFASQYTEVRSLYIEQLAFVWMEDATTETTRACVDDKIDSFMAGDLEHAADIVSALWGIANKDGNVTAPSSTAPTATQTASPAHWTSVNMALIKSIRNGIFFDRKYWARHSKGGNFLKPVYFSSTIMSDKAQQLDKLVKYIKSDSPPINDHEGGANIESDCEGDSPEANGETTKAETEEKNRAVFVTGSFSAWRSLFFYRCTDVILYAPLKSQGSDSRLNYIRANTVPTPPPPCSPKSIYVLANLLGIDTLRDSALADIKSKVSTDNAVEEVLSWAAARQPEIAEMQCELLISNFRNEATIERMTERIENFSDGSSSYCAGALKLGLKKAFELKKKKKQPPGVLLRCGNYSCGWRNNPASYSSVGSNTYCPNCRHSYGNYYMECVGCGYQRTSNYTSCQSCGKKFI